MRRPRPLKLAALLLAAALPVPAAQALVSAPAPAPSARLAPNLVEVLDDTAGSIGVITQFRSAPTDADIAAMRAVGFRPGMIRYSVVDAVYGEASPAAIRRLARNPRVTYIEHDQVFPYSLDRANQAGRTEPVWDATYEVAGALQTGGITGRGIGIAVVDSGVDARHPDLLWKPLAEATGKPAKTVANFKLVGRDSVGISALVPEADEVLETDGLAIDMANTDNTGGHGTHVAGITSGLGAGDARFRGAAPGADLIGYGAGEALVAHLGLAAFDHIHKVHDEYNIRVVNNSWGGAGEWDPDSAVTKAAQKLVNEDGIVVVFAAGNSGGDGSTLQSSVWGNIPEVIQVANYYDRRGWLDDTSSRGLKTREDTWPDLAASGTEVVSTAAVGGPVTYVGTSQDALIARLYGYDEPYVISAPTGGAIDQDVNGQHVIVGDYASFTGTSMAAPFVAGVVALVLEANPALDPFQVRDILRETANLPTGRTYANDGYAVGKGVVDGAHAVAVALRMRDGDTLAQALSSASLDLAASPAEINLAAGPVTDNAIPLEPVQTSLVTGTPQMFHGGVIDLSLFTGDVVVAPGEPVGLSVRNVQSTNSEVAPVSIDNVAASFVMKRDGVVVDGPFTPTIEVTEAVGGVSSFGLTYSYDEWAVPSDFAPGTYVFESTTTILSTGVTYVSSSLPFNVVVGD